jgi:uncharacterized protein (TIGR02145 family)/uncharacterized repeat protein (TIGR02543 family)
MKKFTRTIAFSLLLTLCLSSFSVTADDIVGISGAFTVDTRQYELLLIAEPDDGGVVSGGGSYLENKEVEVDATAEEHWLFNYWSGDTAFMDDEESASALVTMPAHGISLVANFQHEDEGITITSVAQRLDGSGLIDVYYALNVPDALYDISLLISFDDESTFAPISIDHLDGDIAGVSPGSDKHIVWNGLEGFEGTYSTETVLDITATLVDDEPTLYNLHLEVHPEIAGTVTGTGEYEEGEQVTIAASPEEGWEFVEWTGDTDYVDDPVSANAIVTMPGGNVTLTANFEMIDYTLTLDANPEEGGSVSGDGEYNFGDEILVEADANEGWEFVNWTGDTQHLDDANAAEAIVTMPSDDVTLTANFEMIDYTLVINLEPANIATVIPDPLPPDYQPGDDIILNFGETITLTLYPEEGWEFVEWTGDIEYLDDADAAEATLTMPAADVSLTANFQEVDDSDIIYGDGVTDIDGNEYVTVIIGNQEWMAENLRVTRYKNEDAIPTGLSNADWSSTTSGAYAIYNNDDDMLEAYGKLYNWYAVDDSRGLCPAGWSVPSDADWTALVNYVVSQGFPNEWDNPNGAGNALKSCRQVNSPLGGDCNTSEHPRWNSDGTHHGFDEFGFSALPGGGRWSDGSFSNVGGYGLWWSAAELSGTYAWGRSMSSVDGSVGRSSGDKRDGFSVRCLRDATEEPTTYNLQLEADPEDAGSVSGAGEYQEGDVVNITATPNEGWEFVEWTGDIEYLDDADAAEAVVTMPADDVTLTANFQEAGDPEPGTVTDIDGNVYQTVIIGNQEWMAENLRVTRDASGNDITRYCYKNNTTNCELYGGLYTWHTVMNGQSSSSSNPSGVQGICPTGWHVPSDAEWTELVNYVVDQGYPNSSGDPNGAGNALKSCRQVGSPLGGDCDTSEHPRWNSHSTHYGFDEFGFSALPGGSRWSDGSFNFLGTLGFWWSSTEYSSTLAWRRSLRHHLGNVDRRNDTKTNGISLRCVRDLD